MKPAPPRPVSAPSLPRTRFHQALRVALCLVVPCTGCDLDSNFGDLGEKLLDPDAQGLDGQAERLLSGPQFSLGVDTSDADGPIALAISDADELSIVHLADRSSCSVGNALRYGPSFDSPGERPLIPLWVPDTEFGSRLRFTDFDCNLQLNSEPSSSFPIALLRGFEERERRTVLTRSGTSLIVLDPWSEFRRVVAEDVREGYPVPTPRGFAWVEGEELVSTNTNLSEVQRVGRGVQGFTMHRGLGELAWFELVPDTEPPRMRLLAAPLEDLSRAEELSGDACAARYIETAAGPQLSYRSPCAEGRLLLQPRSPSADAVEIASDVAAGPRSSVASNSTWLTYVTSGEANADTQLWLKRDDQSAVSLGTSPTLSYGRTTASGGWLALVDYDDTSGGRLIEWQDGTSRDIATGVVELGTLSRVGGDETLLANFDGVVGDAYRLAAGEELELIASAVPRGGRIGAGFLSNFDGATGTLQLLDSASGSTRQVATNVPFRGFRELQQISGVMALAGHDAETRTNTLEVHFTELDLRFEVHDLVTEAREVAFPRQGLMYNVVEGPDAGLWFVGIL